MAKKNQKSSDAAISYNEFKEYEGQRYTGERLHDVTEWAQVQDRAQARGHRKVERDAKDAAQANDQVSARADFRSREAAG